MIRPAGAPPPCPGVIVAIVIGKGHQAISCPPIRSRERHDQYADPRNRLDPERAACCTKELKHRPTDLAGERTIIEIRAQSVRARLKERDATGVDFVMLQTREVGIPIYANRRLTGVIAET